MVKYDFDRDYTGFYIKINMPVEIQTKGHLGGGIYG